MVPDDFVADLESDEMSGQTKRGAPAPFVRYSLSAVGLRSVSYGSVFQIHVTGVLSQRAEQDVV